MTVYVVLWIGDDKDDQAISLLEDEAELADLRERRPSYSDEAYLYAGEPGKNLVFMEKLT